MHIHEKTNIKEVIRRTTVSLRLLGVILLLSAIHAMGAGEPELFKVEGLVNARPESGVVGTWTLGVSTVNVTADTIITEAAGTLDLGACAEALGTRNVDGSLTPISLATTISSECVAGAPEPELKLIGPVTKLPSDGLIGEWTIRNRVILVTEDTEVLQLVGPVRRGACVEVGGLTGESGAFVAVTVAVRASAGGCSIHSKQNRDDGDGPNGGDDTEDSIEFNGILQQLPSDGQVGIWIVGGREVGVTEDTIIDQNEGMLEVGACLEVEGMLLEEGKVAATKISVESAKQCGKLGKKGKDELVSFYGKVKSLPEGTLLGVWEVGERSVLVGDETDLDEVYGPIELGACVEVKALPTTGALLAKTIETSDPAECDGDAGTFKFYGVIEELPSSGLLGTWVVAGREIKVFPTTEIDDHHGSPVLGACVEIHGTLFLDGSVNAAEIEVKSSSGACVIRHGVVSAASFTDAPVSPGKIISVFGIGIGPDNPTYPNAEALLRNGKFPKALGGVMVYFDDDPAPLVFVSQGQLNAVVPYSVAGKETVEMQIEYKGIWSPVVTLKVEEAAPGIFTLNQSGQGAGAILNYVNGNYVVNSATTRAKRGSIVLIYVTGEGAMEPALEDGEIVSSTRLAKPKLPVKVLIGGVEAVVEYAGSTPNLVAGLLQLNVVVSPNTPVGSAVKVEVYIGGKKSQDDVTMAVAP